METHCLSGIVSGDAVYLTFKDNGHSAGQEGFLGPGERPAGGCLLQSPGGQEGWPPGLGAV